MVRKRTRNRQGESVSLPVRAMLSVIGHLGPLYRVLRVDHGAMLELLRTHWILDDRRRRREGSTPGIGSLGLALMFMLFFLIGLGMGAAAFAIEDPMIYMSVVTTAVFAMLIFPLLSDFSVVLFDTSDIEFLSSLPIEDRTVVASRVTALTSYVGLLVVALGFGPVVIGFFAYLSPGYLPVVFLALAQGAGLAVACVLIFYLTALKTLDLSRFRDALVYVQAGAVVVFYATMQLGPRLADRLGVYDWLVVHPELVFLLPTTAPGALLRMAEGRGEPTDGWLVLIGLASSALLIAWALYLARDGVVSQLAQLESSGGRAIARARTFGLSGRLGRHLRGKLDRAGWSFFMAMCSSDRAFKMRTLPTLAFVVIPLLSILLIDDGRQMEGTLSLLPYAPYVFLMLVSSVWNMAYFAEAWEGRWIFDELEGRDQAQVTRGAMQACVARYLLAPLLWAVPIMFFLLSLERFVGFVFAAGVAARAVVWSLPRYGMDLPFTRKASTMKSAGGENLVLSLGMVFLAFLLGGVQVLLAQVPYVIPIGTPVVLFLAYRAWRGFQTLELPERHRRRPRKRKRSRATIEA